MKEEKYIIRESLRIRKELVGIKVTNVWEPFWMNGDGFQKISIMTTKTEPKKVTNMVGTFLNKGRDGFQKISIKIPKTD
ncbi:hypothetical protein [Emticicia sp. BO119]|uniref:hypothetical protein n=1 Tax=Emticicia sp. BO119 TaxID=2757768 RepID=UPI0015F0EBF4|nr:hypothetical protein [Emticicia sp. BO119]MBA4852936.1 hypothetical protein [Emticicia sp. BO119]